MLQDQIKEQVKQAMRDRNAHLRDLLRVVLGEVETQAAREGKDLSDERVQQIIRKLIKSNLETFAVSSDQATREKLQQEIAILKTLLPKTLSEDEIIAALESVADAIRAAGNDGQATGVAMKHLKSTDASGAVEGGTVAAAVRTIRNG